MVRDISVTIYTFRYDLPLACQLRTCLPDGLGHDVPVPDPAPRQIASLFDRLVGAGQHCRWKFSEAQLGKRKDVG